MVDFAANRAKSYGANELYKGLTGDDEGLPDPMKDEATEYLKEKFNLSDEQAENLKKVMPGLYDLAGKVRGKVNKVYQNNVQKETKPIKVSGNPLSTRALKVGDEKYSHEIYRREGKLLHVLKDGKGNPVAEIEGSPINYNGENGLAISWSKSSTKGKGDGKRLYDLVLDTHKKVFSDQSLSPEGSHRVYADHFPNRPGVSVDLAEWGTPNRHSVSLTDDKALRKDLKAGVIPKKARDYLENIDPEETQIVESSRERAARRVQREDQHFQELLEQAQIGLNNGVSPSRIINIRTASLPERLRGRFAEAVNSLEVKPTILTEDFGNIYMSDLMKAAEGLSFNHMPRVKSEARKRILEGLDQSEDFKKWTLNWAKERVDDGLDDDGFWESILKAIAA